MGEIIENALQNFMFLYDSIEIWLSIEELQTNDTPFKIISIHFIYVR